MGLFSRKKDDDRPMTPEELLERSAVDGIRYRDLQLVGVMSEAGADIYAPRDLTFFLHLPEAAATTPVAEALRERGFETKVMEPWENNPQWVVVADSRDRAMVPDFLRDTLDFCEELAAQHGGVCDGWEAGPTDAEAAALNKKG